MELMTATTARPLPRWAWILAFLLPPYGVFIALGFARVLSWSRCLVLAAASLGNVIALVRIESYLDEVHADPLMRAFGQSGFLLLYGGWLFAIYWIGRRASYWSSAGLRGWRWAGWFAVAMYILNVINVLISIALLWVGES